MANFKDTFITPEKFEELKFKELAGPNGWLLFVACNSGIELAKKVEESYEKRLKENKSELKVVPLLCGGKNGEPMTMIFDDTETRPRLPEHVAGSNAFVFQSVLDRTSNITVNDNLMQLLQMIRTLKVHRAKKITAVTPYSAYSRQDKPTFHQREATLAKLVADLLITAGMDEILFYHLHTDAIKGFYEPHGVIALTGLDLFIETSEKFRGLKNVIAISTDAGGAKFTIHYAEAMGIDYGITSKVRPKDQEANILGVIGELDGKNIALITDDETVTANSIIGAAKSLSEERNINEIYAAISHNKLNKKSIPKLIEANEKYNLKELHVTDSIPQTKEVLELPFVKVHALTERITYTINRLHYNQSVREIFYRSNK
ncbi:MAG: ribose-phosphate diphosphokinase [Candidatus Woesearchaeota archaeon]|nr:ribose-phosphate diphosphokinase [Candidatus Woesearchaeota archaeon]